MCPLFRWGIWKKTPPGKVNDRTQAGLASGSCSLSGRALPGGPFLSATHRPPSFLKTLHSLGKEQPLTEQLPRAGCSTRAASLTSLTIRGGNWKAQRGWVSCPRPGRLTGDLRSGRTYTHYDRLPSESFTLGLFTPWKPLSSWLSPCGLSCIPFSRFPAGGLHSGLFGFPSGT